jgi:hypothetical protein
VSAIETLRMNLLRWERSTPAAVATLLVGLAIGGSGFIRFTRQVASDNNAAMLEVAGRQAEGTLGGAEVTTAAPVALTMLAPLAFVIATPLGWLSAYLVATGFIRSVAAVVREPRGDPLLGLALRTRRGWGRRRTEARETIAREALEGPEVADRLATAARFEIEGADFVVVASRRKEIWVRGTVLDCDGRYFRVGTAVDRTLPGGLRTLYPLIELPGTEVFRRVVRYDLPALQPDPPKG